MPSNWIQLIVCLLLLLLFSGTGNTQETPQQTVSALLRAQQFEQAETASRSYLSATPNDCALHAMLGLALRGEGKSDAAYQAFLAGLKVCPQSLPLLEGAAQIAYSQQLHAAEDLLTRLLHLRPEDETAHAMLGALEARAGKCAPSVENYSRAPAALASNPKALRQYAGCLLMLNRTSEAVQALTQLLALEDSPEVRVQLAQAQNDAGDHEQALATLNPLLAPDSQDAAALLLGAQIAENAGRTPQAVAWLRQAFLASPKNPDGYVAFAAISFAHGSFQVGIDFVNAGLVQLPGNARLLTARGVLEVQIGKLDDGLADFEQAHRLDPHLSLAEDAIGVLFSQKHDNSQALELFQNKVKEKPDDPLLQYLYAEALSEGAATEDTKTRVAIAAARRSVQLEPSYLPARDLLCRLLLRRGDLEDTVEQANEATKRDPYDEQAIYQELLAERKLNHPDLVAQLVERLQQAKAHNQASGNKYTLQEEGTAHE